MERRQRDPARAILLRVTRARQCQSYERMHTLCSEKNGRIITPTWWQRPLRTQTHCQSASYDSTTGCLSFHPMAQCVVHALKGLACRARVTQASSPASHWRHCKQLSALTSPALHACGGASPSRACRGHKNHDIFFEIGPKLRYPEVIPTSASASQVRFLSSFSTPIPIVDRITLPHVNGEPDFSDSSAIVIHASRSINT